MKILSGAEIKALSNPELIAYFRDLVTSNIWGTDPTQYNALMLEVKYEARRRIGNSKLVWNEYPDYRPSLPGTTLYIACYHPKFYIGESVTIGPIHSLDYDPLCNVYIIYNKDGGSYSYAAEYQLTSHTE